MTKPNEALPDRALRQLVPSKCLHCRGTFARKPWLPNCSQHVNRANEARIKLGLPPIKNFRPDKCESCGAARHWEKRGGASAQVLLPGETPTFDQPRHLGPRIADVDGTTISAEELLQARYDRLGNRIDGGTNHGRSKTVIPSLASLELDTKNAGVVRIGRSRGWRNNSRNVETDLLAAGGWHIRKAGTTGAPVGRRPSGAVGDSINALIERAFRTWNAWLLRTVAALVRAGEIEVARNVHIAGVLAEDVNAQAAADRWGRDISTVNRRRRAGEAWINRNPLYILAAVGAANWPLPKKSPKRGGVDTMDTTAIVERLDRIETTQARMELLEAMRGETMDRIRETLDELVARFPGNSAIETAVARAFNSLN